MEEQFLRFNNRVESGAICRKELKDIAVVTTCSHVLCQECAQSTKFIETDSRHRRCPVCKQPLPHSDDAAEVMVIPTEDYKTSVLCGLDPTTIMECASNALSFWNYQMLQETAYQQHLLVALSKKYTGLNNSVQKLEDEANGHIAQMQGKITELSQEKTDIHQKNLKLAETCRERNKKYGELRKGYDSLKKLVQQTHQLPITEEVAEQAIRQFAADSALGSIHEVDGNRSGQHNSNNIQYVHKVYSVNDQGGLEHIYQRQGGGSSTHGGEAPRTLPPQKPYHIHERLSPRDGPTQNRTPLPNVFRAAADRSRPGTSASRTHQSPFIPPGSAQRYSFKPSIPHNTSASRHGSSHSLGGISAGMKVGNANSDRQPQFPPGYVSAREAQAANSSHVAPVVNASRYFG